MAYITKKRVFHSMCYLNGNEIVVTGSRIDEDGADTSVEKFNIDRNTWTNLPSMLVEQISSVDG